MRRLLLLATVGTVAALAVSAPASAKGPTTASLSGPGLDRAVPVKGQGESGPGTTLGSVVQYGGFFPQVFGQTPDPLTRKPPAGDLGLRYRITYRVPGPSGTNTLVQDVYPYAKPSPVTHMRAGLQFFGGMHTHGGWYVSEGGLKTALVKAGLPKTPPPEPSSGSSFPWAWMGAGIAAVFLLLALDLRRRGIRRPRTLRSSTA